MAELQEIQGPVWEIVPSTGMLQNGRPKVVSQCRLLSLSVLLKPSIHWMGEGQLLYSVFII